MIVLSFTSAVQLPAGSVEFELYGRRICGTNDIRASFAVTSEKPLTNVFRAWSTEGGQYQKCEKVFLNPVLGSVDPKLSL